MLAQVGRFEFETTRFDVIKEKPLIYWWDEAFLNRYDETAKLGDLFQSRKGTWTSDNTRFLRLPHEVVEAEFHIRSLNVSSKNQYRWLPYVGGAKGQQWIDALTEVLCWEDAGLEIKLLLELKHGAYPQGTEYFFRRGIAFSQIGANFSARVHRYPGAFGGKGSSIFPQEMEDPLCVMNNQISRFILSSLNPGVGFELGDVNRLPLFPIESATEIFAQLEAAFTTHEAAREPSVEFISPGATCWSYAQAWAQRAVDRPAGEPLPAWQPTYEQPPATDWISYAVGLALGRFPLASPLQSQSPESEAHTAITPLPHGIFYLSAYSADQQNGPDSLTHPACAPLHEAWATHSSAITKKSLHEWLRLHFFKDVHLGMYEQRPIYFPLSSANKKLRRPHLHPPLDTPHPHRPPRRLHRQRPHRPRRRTRRPRRQQKTKATPAPKPKPKPATPTFKPSTPNSPPSSPSFANAPTSSHPPPILKTPPPKLIKSATK